MQDVLFVSGTRPEIIELAPLLHRWRREAGLWPTWLHTGQNDGMATQMLACFDITTDIALVRTGSSLCEFTATCRMRLEEVMASRKWSMVVVQGDTESAFIGALAAYYQRLPVAHVEAGLRTRNLDLREETKRPEAIDAGCAKLAGTTCNAIVDRVEELWCDKVAHRRMQHAGNPFGGGRASERIAGVIGEALAGDRPNVAALA